MFGARSSPQEFFFVCFSVSMLIWFLLVPVCTLWFVLSIFFLQRLTKAHWLLHSCALGTNFTRQEELHLKHRAKENTSFTHLESTEFRVVVQKGDANTSSHTNSGLTGLNGAAFQMTAGCRGAGGTFWFLQSEVVRCREETCWSDLVEFKLWLGGLSTVAATLADNQPSLGCFTVF